MKLKDKKKSKVEEDKDMLNTFLESYKRENPNSTEEELLNAQKIFETINQKLNNKKPIRSMLLELLRSFFLYYVVVLTMSGLMNKFIILEPFNLIFLVMLAIGGFVLALRFGLSLLAGKFGKPFIINILGLGLTIGLAAMLNSLFLPVFNDGITVIMFFIGAEIFYQLFRFVLLRKALRSIWS